MELKDMITRRKSTRSYTGVSVDEETLEKIRGFVAKLHPLYPDIPFAYEIVTKAGYQSILRFLPPQSMMLYTTEQEGAMENIGFLFQQLELYLHTLGLGVCWVGMARPKGEKTRGDGLSFAIMLAFGHPAETLLRTGAADMKRKSLAEISDRADERLEPARLAPSSINSQPWYFVHDGDTLHVYCSLSGFLRKKVLGKMNLIDMGIALAHLYVVNPETFRYFKVAGTAEVKGYQYIGSCVL